MKSFLLFIGITIFGKFVKDNLPDLSIHNLNQIFQEKLVPIILLAFIVLICLRAKVTRNPEKKKRLNETAIVGLLALILGKWFSVNYAKNIINKA